MGRDQRASTVAATASPHHDRWTRRTTLLATLLFVALGGAALSGVYQRYVAGGPAIDSVLTIALLLNIALILIGWRRHHALSSEVALRTAAAVRANLLAARDPLTGFLNRRSLADEGASLLQNAARRHKAVALMMIDLDHFKTINDLHGHAIGDVLLRQVAAAINETLPNGAIAARIGGDEFACAFLFDAGHPVPVERVIEQMLSRLSQPFACEGLLLDISASIGVAGTDQGCATIDTLLRAADAALYAAKHAGRNRFAWFDRALEREQEARIAMETSLQRAIQRQEIAPWFEQQIDLASGKLVGFEVLARWEQGNGSVLDPAMFMPIAERTGMIAELSLSVMGQAFAAARDWDAGLTLSVNLAPRQLKDAWLAQKIIKLMTEAAFPPSRLEVEVTEAALFDNLALVQSTLASLKNQGVGLVLDDFGNGFASLSHLRAILFDRIKIAPAFIGAMADSSDHAVTVNAVARLGECFNLPITAVGIADPATAERVRALGCARGQGYHYARPASIANTRRLLGQRGLLQRADAALATTRRNRA